MKKIIDISTIPGEFHSALGPKYRVSFTGEVVKDIYAEHLFDLTDFNPFNTFGLVGLEVSEEWINQF